jgi:3-phosphoshikimate 1-carboxyvinyltransferase
MKGLKRPANHPKLLQQECAHDLVIIEDPHLPQSASRTKFFGRRWGLGDQDRSACGRGFFRREGGLARDWTAPAVAALGADGEVLIEEAEAINKSYPDFYEHLKALGTSIALQTV